jgi:hypothetical protein
MVCFKPTNQIQVEFMILKDCIKQVESFLFDNIPSFTQNSIDLCYKALECLVIKDDSCTERLNSSITNGEYHNLLKYPPDCALEGIKNYCEKILDFPFLTETNIDSLDNIRTNLTDISTEDLLHAISTNLTTINDNDSNKNNWLEIDASTSIVIGVASAVISLLIAVSSAYLWNKNRKIKAKKNSLQEKEEVLKVFENILMDDRHEINKKKELANTEIQNICEERNKLSIKEALLKTEKESIQKQRIKLEKDIEYHEKGYLIPSSQQHGYINMRPAIHYAATPLDSSHHYTDIQEDPLLPRDNILYSIAIFNHQYQNTDKMHF